MSTIRQHNSLSLEKFGIGFKMFIHLRRIMGWGKGYLGLIFQNLDHFIFQKDPEQLIKLCDDVSNLKGFNREKCTSDVVNAYNIFHEAFPEMYNNLLTPAEFNRLLATVEDQSLFSEEGGYKNINEIESLKKYLIDYSKNPPKNNDLNLPDIDLPIDESQSLIRNIFSFYGWINMLIQMVQIFWSLGSKLKQLYDQRTEQANSAPRVEVPEESILPVTAPKPVTNESNNSTEEETPKITVIDDDETPDVEQGLRKRR